MKFNLNEGADVVNEWNMVGGYYDLQYRLLTHYYEASLTVGIGDDVEALKRFIDHVSCKIRVTPSAKLTHGITDYTTQKVKDKKLTIMIWLDSKISMIELLNTELSQKPQNKWGREEYKKLTEIKLHMRYLLRDILFICQKLGDFDKSRTLKGKTAANKAFEGSTGVTEETEEIT